MTMVEQVARAIAGAEGSGSWYTYVPAARAAITAMREPAWRAAIDAALSE